MVRLDDYPQLRQLAWNRPAATVLDDAEALALIEAQWRLLDPDSLTAEEWSLIDRLRREVGAGVLLV